MVRERSDLLIFVSGAIGIALLAAVLVYGQPPQNDGGSQPAYQRHGPDSRRDGHDRHRDKFNQYGRRTMPQVSSGWFQRPYPYHLDYYKMRYGGSYAPYFGNLYGVPFGTPQVVYGGLGQGTGDWGNGGGAYPIPGYEWMEGPRPQPRAEVNEPSNDQPSTDQKKDESLPPPAK